MISDRICTIRDAYGEYTSTEAKYYHIRHGFRFVAIGIPEQDFFFLVRELFPGEPSGEQDTMVIMSEGEPVLKGIVVATMPCLEAADSLVENFQNNVRRAEGRS